MYPCPVPRFIQPGAQLRQPLNELGIAYNYCVIPEDVDGLVYPDEHRTSVTFPIYFAQYNYYFREVAFDDPTKDMTHNIKVLFK